MRHSIGIKLAGAFAAILLLLGASNWLAFAALVEVRQEYEGLMAESYPAVQAAQRLSLELQSQSQKLMHYAATQDPAPLQGISASRQQSARELTELERTGKRDAAVGRIVAEMRKYQAEFDKSTATVLDEGESMTLAQLVLHADHARGVGERLNREVDKLITLLKQRQQAAEAAVAAASRQAASLMILFGSAGLAAGLIAMGWTHRVITVPLRALADHCGAISKGVLTERLTLPSGRRDEIGVLTDGFVQMQSSLTRMVGQIVAASQEVSHSAQQVKSLSRSVAVVAQEVSAVSNHVTSNAVEQAARSAEANRTMSELAAALNDVSAGTHQNTSRVLTATEIVTAMAGAVKDVASRAQEMTLASAGASEAARSGTGRVAQTLASMERIRERVTAAARQVQQVGENTTAITDFMKVIQELAEQTRMLALNAAIEAARAGEHGRGFAVVAQEVRRLSERTSGSARQIHTLVESIQSGMATTRTAMDEASADVQEGAALSESAGAALQEIVQVLQETLDGIQSISAAANNVLSSTDSVVHVVQEMTTVLEASSSATEEIADGSSKVAVVVQGAHQIAEANSAAMEEVSASISDVGHSVRNMTEAAEDLDRVSLRLQNLVGQFHM